MLSSPHRRFNPLTREWVLVSPQRAQRPWLGQVEKSRSADLPGYDPACYLCPGNERAGGIRNPAYTSTFVFDNDFAALLPNHSTPNFQSLDPELFQTDFTPGLCRVICFSPRHDRTLPELALPEVETVLHTWADQTRELGALAYINYVQVFENKGEIMGCSNPHPHSQIWSSSHIPNEPAKELSAQTDYWRDHNRPLLLDYVSAELKQGERIVLTNDHFTALVPFWAIWPFEVMVVAHRPVTALPDLTPAEFIALADILKRLTAKYDNLFEISFPYSMGFHQAPTDQQPHPEWVLHAHFYPPLLRSASVKKFMVGYEMLAMPQRDITPEQAAERLRRLSVVHYKSH
jgi:UDPglucose--hexose-1-phosphate uridylyltransferase